MTKLLDGIVAFGSVLLLAVTLIGAGFAVVAIPDAATATLSRAFSGCDQPNTPFTADELASMAIAGKHYTFDDNDREKLDAAIAEANAAAEAGGRATASTRESAACNLPADAISHLDDVYRVASMAKPALAIMAVLCIAGLAHVAVRIGRRALGRTLIAGGGLVLAAFCALGAWAAIDFDGLFAAFHSLFFQAGTWTFPYDSLLITLYPTAFWMGMGGIWLAVTCGLSILAVLIGFTLGHKQHD
ncbi:lipoprotein intramolecular transacylase Lit [Senegalimassilia anaerobia]